MKDGTMHSEKKSKKWGKKIDADLMKFLKKFKGKLKIRHQKGGVNVSVVVKGNGHKKCKKHHHRHGAKDPQSVQGMGKNYMTSGKKKKKGRMNHLPPVPSTKPITPKPMIQKPKHNPQKIGAHQHYHYQKVQKPKPMPNPQSAQNPQKPSPQRKRRKGIRMVHA